MNGQTFFHYSATFWRVLRGIHSPFLEPIFRGPLWEPPRRKITSRLATFLKLQWQRLIQAWPVTIAGVILGVMVGFYGGVMKNDTLITLDITFAGLISIAIGVVVGIAPTLQSFRRWLRVILGGAGIGVSAIVSACGIGQALLAESLSPLVSLLGWILLVRSLWICVRCVDVEYVLHRITEESRIQVAGMMREFDVGISIMGYPTMTANRLLSLYWSLALADYEWIRSNGPRLRLVVSPHATDPTASAKFQSTAQVSVDQQAVLDIVNRQLEGRFVVKKQSKRLKILVQ